MLAASATKTFEMYKMRCLYQGIFDLTNSNLADFKFFFLNSTFLEIIKTMYNHIKPNHRI